MDTIQTVVVGAGVVGLAVARKLAREGREVILLEREGIINSGVSSRNSEVIHAGIYYPRGSLKSILCVLGRKKLYHFCNSYGVPYQRIGKIIVASQDSEVPALRSVRAKAAANGVDDLRPLSSAELGRMEPELKAAEGLFSPSTGIVDSHALSTALLGDAEAHGAVLAFHSPIVSAQCTDGGFILTVGANSGRFMFRCREVVNATGLSASAVAQMLGTPMGRVPKTYFAKGNYFRLIGRSAFKHLIYPVPVPGGLGTHLTLDLGGQARFGPDVEWIERINYDVDPERAAAFYAAIRRYWPSLPEDSLVPDYAGVRPKISRPGAGNADFMIQGPADHGVDGLVNLFGIESPGLTASLAIADHVYGLLDDTGWAAGRNTSEAETAA